MTEKRIRNLSTRWLRLYKAGVYSVLLALIVIAVAVAFRDVMNHRRFFPLAMVAVVGYFTALTHRSLRRTFRVEFDKDFLYILEGNQDTLIPLENIRSVRLLTVGGVFIVQFQAREKWGDHIYFKPSLWYPFNFRKKDAQVALLREAIEQARKRNPPAFRKNTLQS